MAAPWPANSIVTNKDGSISVNWANAGLTDEVVEQFANNRLETLLAGLPNTGIECVIDISGNQLSGPVALAALLRRLRTAPVHITVLRLYNNRLIDTTSAVLAEHLNDAAEQQRPLMQLHLSGNQFTTLGARVIIEAAHRCGAYPLDGVPELRSLGFDAGRRCLWLRLERQRPLIDDPAALLSQCEEKGFPVHVSAKDRKPPPDTVVEIHFSFLQGPGFEEVNGSGKSMGKGKSFDGKGAAFSDSAGAAEGAPAKGVKGGKLNEVMAEGKGRVFTGGFKTELCRFFERGLCQKDDRCPFAHGEWELRRAAPGAAGSATATASSRCTYVPQAPGRYKTVLCQYFSLRGACDKGADCTFAHGLEEIQIPGQGAGGGSAVPSTSGNAPEDLRPQVRQAVAEPAVGSSLYKRALCKYFEAGTCKSGPDCTFAHGAADLRSGPAADAAPPARRPDAVAEPAMGSSLYKRALCKYFEAGTCRSGPDCTFAHGVADLRSGPAADAAPAARRPDAAAEPALYKRAICKYFEAGTCRNGPDCTFAHGAADLRGPVAEAAPQARRTEAAAEPAAGGHLYKRYLCTFFSTTGSCRRGADCTFAHGPEELRDGSAAPGTARPAGQPPAGASAAEGRPANYKVRLCAYHAKGACSNGESCVFAHGEHELRGQRGPGAARAAALDPEQEAMAWLKVHREQPGEEGARFEKAWKAWCKAQDVHSMPKEERLKTVASFRAFWEAAHDTVAPASSGSGVSPMAAQDEGRRAATPEAAEAPSRADAAPSRATDSRSHGGASEWLRGDGVLTETNEQRMLRLLGRAPRQAA